MKFDALNGRISGTLEIQPQRIVFTSDKDGAQIVIPFNGIQIVIEGVNSQHYYLSNLSDPSRRICVQQKTAIQMLADQGVAAAEKVLKVSQNQKLKKGLIYSSPILMVLLLLIIIPFSLSWVPVSWLDSMLTQQQEKQIGKWLFPILKAQHMVVEQHPAQQKIQRLIEQIQNANQELKNFQLEVYISTSPDVNAFAAPGNIIVVNRGLIDKADTIDEVTGVLAHELGHIQQKHVIKGITARMGSLAGLLLLSSFIGYDGASVVVGVTDFLSLKYSRDDELAADRKGVDFLNRAGFSKSGMVGFFQKMAKEHEALPALLNFASTHPPSKERAQILDDIREDFTPSKGWSISLKELQQEF